jgi:hypothetical protein
VDVPCDHVCVAREEGRIDQLYGLGGREGLNQAVGRGDHVLKMELRGFGVEGLFFGWAGFGALRLGLGSRGRWRGGMVL